jgi:hypothetical protein
MGLPSQRSEDPRKIDPYVFNELYDFQVKESLLWQSARAIDTYCTDTIRTTKQKVARAARTDEQSLPRSNAHV